MNDDAVLLFGDGITAVPDLLHKGTGRIVFFGLYPDALQFFFDLQRGPEGGDDHHIIGSLLDLAEGMTGDEHGASRCRALAQQFWPNQDPIGKLLKGVRGGRVYEVIGVAGFVTDRLIVALNNRLLRWSPQHHV